MLTFFRDSTGGKCETFQFCLNIIDKLIKIVYSYLEFEKNVKLNKKFSDLLDEKLLCMICIHFELRKAINADESKQNIFVPAIFCLQVIIN